MSPPQDHDLAPLRDPVGLLSDYIAVGSTTLILEETASGYDFDITDRITGAKIFTVKGNTDSQTASKEVLDTKGHQMFALRKDNTRAPEKSSSRGPRMAHLLWLLNGVGGGKHSSSPVPTPLPLVRKYRLLAPRRAHHLPLPPSTTN